MDFQKWNLKVGLYVVCNLLSWNLIIYETFSAWLHFVSCPTCALQCMVIFLPDCASYRFLLLTRSVCYEIKTYTLSEDLHCILTIWILSVNPCYLIIKNMLNDLVQFNDRYYIAILFASSEEQGTNACFGGSVQGFTFTTLVH